MPHASKRVLPYATATDPEQVVVPVLIGQSSLSIQLSCMKAMLQV